MAGDAGESGIGAQLKRFGKLLENIPADRREAFFKWVEKEDPAPLGGNLAPQEPSASALPSAGAIRLIGPRKPTSVALSDPLMAALREYTVEQGIRLSMSALVELLIWQFLGEPRDLVEVTPIPRQKRQTPTGQTSSSDFIAAITDKSVISILESEDDNRDNKGRRTKKTK